MAWAVVTYTSNNVYKRRNKLFRRSGRQVNIRQKLLTPLSGRIIAHKRNLASPSTATSIVLMVIIIYKHLTYFPACTYSFNCLHRERGNICVYRNRWLDPYPLSPCFSSSFFFCFFKWYKSMKIRLKSISTHVWLKYWLLTWQIWHVGVNHSVNDVRAIPTNNHELTFSISLTLVHLAL